MSCGRNAPIGRNDRRWACIAWLDLSINLILGSKDLVVHIIMT
jgi:hypothetical protein